MLSRALASPTRHGNCAEQLKQASPMKQPYFCEIGFHDCGLVCSVVDVVSGPSQPKKVRKLRLAAQLNIDHPPSREHFFFKGFGATHPLTRASQAQANPDQPRPSQGVRVLVGGQEDR